MKILFAGLALFGCAALSLWLWAKPQPDARFEALAERLRELDEASPGQLGVYLLRPADGSELNHQADRTWYLASATKAAIAIAVLQEVDDGKLQLDQPITLEEAYRRYYETGVNSASLVAYGQLFGKLTNGELLSDASTALLYDIMGLDSYEAYRLEAGLSEQLPFIQKTGTQRGRACHMGIANPQSDDALVILACAEALDEDAEAGKLFEQVGEAVQELVLDRDEAEAA